MRVQHTRACSPLEAALWKFRYQEKQWQAQKAALRRDADAQHKIAPTAEQTAGTPAHETHEANVPGRILERDAML